MTKRCRNSAETVQFSRRAPKTAAKWRQIVPNQAREISPLSGPFRLTSRHFKTDFKVCIRPTLASKRFRIRTA